ncbi:MAG: hypothetical protein F6K26_27100 [Moorea sp. SIO2I5]|nr:hypothetical protein [Moorena sp. SIO2I5]
MVFNWPTEELTVRGKIGIGTDTPSQELEVIGDISATNLNLNGSLTIDENLTVGGNFQLGTLSINAFSSDGNLADKNNLAVPTEQNDRKELSYMDIVGILTKVVQHQQTEIEKLKLLAKLSLEEKLDDQEK